MWAFDALGAKTINLEVEGLSIRFRFLHGQLKAFLKKKKVI